MVRCQVMTAMESLMTPSTLSSPRLREENMSQGSNHNIGTNSRYTQLLSYVLNDELCFYDMDYVPKNRLCSSDMANAPFLSS